MGSPDEDHDQQGERHQRRCQRAPPDGGDSAHSADENGRPHRPERPADAAEYHHREGISITGGQVYRGKTMPELVGHYIYADYVSGRMWSVKEDRKGGEHQVQLLIRKAGAVASFAEGADGEVFVLTFEPHKILKLVRKTEAKKSGQPAR